jgi:hypothetical protein
MNINSDIEQRLECIKASAAAMAASCFAIGYGHFKLAELLKMAHPRPLNDLTLPLLTQLLLDLRYLPLLVPVVLIVLVLISRQRPLFLTFVINLCWLYSLALPLFSIAAWYFPYAH